MMRNKMSDIGQTIREARREIDLTQEGLAELAGVSIRSLQNIESGGNPTVYQVGKVLEALGLKLKIEPINK